MELYSQQRYQLHTEPEEENRRLRQMYAELILDVMMLKDVLSKKW